MTLPDLWNFVRQYGLTGKELAALAIGTALLILGVYVAWRSFHTPREELTIGSVVSPLIALLISGGFLLLAWSMPRARYLLRPGAGRYTVATVYKHKRWRGKPQFVYEYLVSGQHYSGEQSCGIAEWRELPCPALHTRRYAYFAPDDPSTEILTAVPVPDSVRTIPPLGWARIP